MTDKPPSQARVLLLLMGSLIAGILVSSWLGEREERRRDERMSLVEQSLAAESP